MRIAGKVKTGIHHETSDFVSRFMVIDACQGQLVEYPSGSEDENEDEDEGGRRVVKRKIWTECYVLDFNVAPRRPDLGMLIGGLSLLYLVRAFLGWVCI